MTNSDAPIQEMSLNQILIAILETKGKITVPTMAVLDAVGAGKELVIDYDEEGPSFTFSLRESNEQ